ncbi:hypothetical protein [Sporomusa aerivorans]|uniref:hypothetical protein n=1 Tax=Sporomusa aerivorans TaxID=204936 RepID=UPI00352B082D
MRVSPFFIAALENNSGKPLEGSGQRPCHQLTCDCWNRSSKNTMSYAVVEHKASECIACGSCEARCPFKVEGRKNMAEMITILGK